MCRDISRMYEDISRNGRGISRNDRLISREDPKISRNLWTLTRNERPMNRDRRRISRDGEDDFKERSPGPGRAAPEILNRPFSPTPALRKALSRLTYPKRQPPKLRWRDERPSDPYDR